MVTFNLDCTENSENNSPKDTMNAINEAATQLDPYALYLWLYFALCSAISGACMYTFR